MPARRIPAAEQANVSCVLTTVTSPAWRKAGSTIIPKRKTETGSIAACRRNGFLIRRARNRLGRQCRMRPAVKKTLYRLRSSAASGPGRCAEYVQINDEQERSNRSSVAGATRPVWCAPRSLPRWIQLYAEMSWWAFPDRRASERYKRYGRRSHSMVTRPARDSVSVRGISPLMLNKAGGDDLVAAEHRRGDDAGPYGSRTEITAAGGAIIEPDSPPFHGQKWLKIGLKPQRSASGRG